MGTVVSLDARRAKHMKEYEPRRSRGTETWICVDDRFAQLLADRRERAALADTRSAKIAQAAGNLYLQSQGGASGMSYARALAMETQKPGTFINANKPIDTQTGIMATVLRPQGYELALHGSTDKDICGRIYHERDIRRRVIHEQDAVYAVAKVINPELTTAEYERHAESSLRLEQSGLTSTPQLSGARLSKGWTEHPSGLVVPPVPKYPLVQEPHVSSVFKINYGRSAFDSQEAWTAGDAAYQLSYGRLPEVHHTTNAYLGPVSEKLFMGAIAIDAAATALELEHLTNVSFTYEKMAA